jgi:hypothetical protein
LRRVSNSDKLRGDVVFAPITRGWIISRAARQVYFVCALAAFSLLGVLVASHAALAATGFRSLAGFPVAALVIRILVWPGILGTALLATSMWYFWYAFDTPTWLIKAMWFCAPVLAVCDRTCVRLFLLYTVATATLRNAPKLPSG